MVTIIINAYVLGPRRTVVGMRAKVNSRHPADHRVCQNGAWIYETVTGRSDCAA